MLGPFGKHGDNWYVTEILANQVAGLGYKWIALRKDQEPAIKRLKGIVNRT